MKLKTVIVVALFSIGVVSAQQKKWTLQECVEYAVEKNISIKQAELNLEGAEINKLNAKGNFMPSVNARLNHSWNIGLNQNITTGLLENITTQFSSVGLNVGVDVFKGMQNVNRLRRANLSILANKYQLDDMKDDISLAVANSYLQVLFSRENLIVAKAQYAVTEQDLKRVKELVDSGVVPKGDLLEVEATAASLEQQIISSENNLKLSKIGLAQLLLIDDYENFDVANEDFIVPNSLILDNSPKTIFEKAITFRNDIKLSETNIEIAEADIKIAKGALLPTLSASYGYDTRASYQDRVVGSELNTDNPTRSIGVVEATGQSVVSPNFRRITGGPAPIFSQFSDNDGHSIRLNLSVPIFNGFATRNNVKRNKVNLKRSKLQLEQNKLDLENTVNQAWNDTKASLKTYEAAEKTLEARKLAFEYSRERFNVGLMNSFDFSQAQSRVDNAEAQVIRTKYDYIFRLKVLEFYFGIPLRVN